MTKTKIYIDFLREPEFPVIIQYGMFFTDPPGAPGTPDIVDWDKDLVDLKWLAPSRDGGSPITGYLIEKKEVGTTKWTKAAEVCVILFSKSPWAFKNMTFPNHYKACLLIKFNPKCAFFIG